ncbi:MAG: 5-formyltetrahydrofolate cyclo-ligase [Bacteroidales bacterium]
MDTTQQQKEQLRKTIRQKKKMVGTEEAKAKSQLVFAKVEASDKFLEAKVVLAFWSLPDEISTHNFVVKWSTSKKMVLPVVVENNLELRIFTGTEMLVQSDGFGIMEPTTGQLVNPSDIDFAIIPGVAFDKKGNRLGRGKGFYDRLLPQLGKTTTVGVGYEFQLVESVPVAEFDLPVDMVICN